MGSLGAFMFHRHFFDHLPAFNAFLFNERTGRTILFYRSFKILDELLAVPGWLPGKNIGKRKFC